MLDRFLTSNGMAARLARTVLEGLLGLLVVAVPVWCGGHMEPVTASMVTAAVTVCASPLIAVLGGRKPEDGKVDPEEIVGGRHED